MSRTIHRSLWDVAKYDRRRRSRTQLTKGKASGGYDKSAFDYPLGDPHRHADWYLWLRDYTGYKKQRRRRRLRKFMKRYGRRVERQQANQLAQKENMEEQKSSAAVSIPDDKLWEMIHECHGKCHRDFIMGDCLEVWTLCEVCGNWWLHGLYNMKGLRTGRIASGKEDNDR